MERSTLCSSQPVRQGLTLAAGSLAALSASGCAVVEAVFKAGVWVGVLGVAGVLGLLIWGASAALR